MDKAYPNLHKLLATPLRAALRQNEAQPASSPPTTNSLWLSSLVYLIRRAGHWRTWSWQAAPPSWLICPSFYLLIYLDHNLVYSLRVFVIFVGINIIIAVVCHCNVINDIVIFMLMCRILLGLLSLLSEAMVIILIWLFYCPYLTIYIYDNRYQSMILQTLTKKIKPSWHTLLRFTIGAWWYASLVFVSISICICIRFHIYMHVCYPCVCMSVNVYTSYISLYVFMYIKYVSATLFILSPFIFRIMLFNRPRREHCESKYKKDFPLCPIHTWPLQIRKVKHTLDFTKDLDVQPEFFLYHW